jgi:hypothetical protein
MVLHMHLCGRVGRRQIKLQTLASEKTRGAFFAGPVARLLIEKIMQWLTKYRNDDIY